MIEVHWMLLAVMTNAFVSMIGYYGCKYIIRCHLIRERRTNRLRRERL